MCLWSFDSSKSHWRCQIWLWSQCHPHPSTWVSDGKEIIGGIEEFCCVLAISNRQKFTTWFFFLHPMIPILVSETQVDWNSSLSFNKNHKKQESPGHKSSSMTSISIETMAAAKPRGKRLLWILRRAADCWAHFENSPTIENERKRRGDKCQDSWIQVNPCS